VKRFMARQTKEEVLAFLVKAGIICPNERTVVGKEKTDIALLLKLVDPYKSTNNQRFWTDYYKLGSKEYKITHFDDSDYEMIEINDIQQD
jgi:hypothetical protein